MSKIPEDIIQTAKEVWQESWTYDDAVKAIGIALFAEREKAIKTERERIFFNQDLRYLLVCVDTHANKFPVPSHIKSIVARIREHLK